MIRYDAGETALRLRFPATYHEPLALAAAVDKVGGTLAPAGADYLLTLAGPPAQTRSQAAGIFATLQGVPLQDTVDLAAYRPAADPLVSCVILLTGNDHFAARFLIPSIIANSRDFPIEILVVTQDVKCAFRRWVDLFVPHTLDQIADPGFCPMSCPLTPPLFWPNRRTGINAQPNLSGPFFDFVGRQGHTAPLTDHAAEKWPQFLEQNNFLLLLPLI